MNGYSIFLSAVCGLLLAGFGTNPALADMADVESSDKIATEATVSVGYRGTSVHGAPGRTLEYDSLKSSPLFNAKLFTDRGPYHLDLGVNFLNEDDYRAEAHLETKGLLRLDLRTDRFFHNLDHIPYDNGSTGEPPGRVLTATPADGSRPDAFLQTVPRIYYTDWNSGDNYGLRLDTSEAKLKIKFPDYPAHFNLAYWRYEKAGEKPLRFADENCATACHMQSGTRKIDRVTEEVKAGVDAHAGFLDLAVEALYRTFRDRQSTPVDEFGPHSYPLPIDRSAGRYDHDEDPDSTLKELIFRVNTAPSGGVVGSASFTLGERENRSNLSSIAPVKAETDYYKTSADMTYTPGENWTFNFRYRLLDMDSDNTQVLTSNSSSTNPNDLAVREAMDLTRAWYEAVVNYRPSRNLTLKAELRREDIDRSNTGAPVVHHSNGFTLTPVDINPSWQLPDEEIITRIKLGFNGRMLEKSALKVNGWAALQHNDDPAYGTSFSESRELFLSANYTPASFWGILASVNLLEEENDDHQLELSFDTFDLDRKRRQQNVSFGGWLIPREGLSFDLNYGYLRTAIEQDLLFGAEPGFTIEDNSVDYRQTVNTVTVGMTWHPRETLSCRLEGHHIRSKASYGPDFATAGFDYLAIDESTIPGTASSTDLREISKLDLIQNGVRGRINWKLDETWSCGIEATYDDYDERGNDVFDGSVQTAMVSLTRSW